MRALLLSLPAFLPCSAPQFLNGLWTLKEQWTRDLSPLSFLALSSKCCNLYFFTGAVGGGISYLIFDVTVLGRKDVVFLLPAVYMYKTKTGSAGCWFQKQVAWPQLATGLWPFISLLLPPCLKLQSLGIHSAHWGPPYSKWKLPISSWRCKASDTGLGWSSATQKIADILHHSQCVFDFLARVFGLSSDVTVNFCSRKGRRFIPPTRSGVTAPCVTLTFWQRIASVSL